MEVMDQQILKKGIQEAYQEFREEDNERPELEEEFFIGSSEFFSRATVLKLDNLWGISLKQHILQSFRCLANEIREYRREGEGLLFVECAEITRCHSLVHPPTHLNSLGVWNFSIEEEERLVIRLSYLIQRTGDMK